MAGRKVTLGGEHDREKWFYQSMLHFPSVKERNMESWAEVILVLFCFKVQNQKAWEYITGTVLESGNPIPTHGLIRPRSIPQHFWELSCGLKFPDATCESHTNDSENVPSSRTSDEEHNKLIIPDKQFFWDVFFIIYLHCFWDTHGLGKKKVWTVRAGLVWQKYSKW